MQVSQTSPDCVDCDWLVVVCPESDQATDLAGTQNGLLPATLTSVWSRGEFSGKFASTLALRQLNGIAAVNLMLVGTGDVADLTPERLRRSLMTGIRRISTQADQSVAILFDQKLQAAADDRLLSETTADCAVLAAVDAGVHKSEATRHDLRSVELLSADLGTVSEQSLATGKAVGQAVALVRRLVNLSASDLTPLAFVEVAQQLAETHGLTIRILDEAELLQEEMHAHLAVARGSDLQPALVELAWNGQPGHSDRLGLVGKGVTFDSGGLSIKPSDSMIPMKSDMAGAATAMATVVAAAELKLPVNVTAWLGLAENMISGRAFRPGDVIGSRRGITIEVQNTDAEGRLILADALAYAADHGATRLIDLATLTGACVVALGEDITGMFAGSDDLAERLQSAAARTGELVWPMPMHAHFDDLLRSDVADCRNIGPRWGGAITAACFLRKFVGETPWVHLDIAGPSWGDASAGWRDSGGTGAMVRTLVQLLRDQPASAAES